MRAADYARLVALAAIWGASFMFMRVAAPSLGPIWTAELRVLLGGAALLVWFRLTGFDPALKRHGPFYLLVGTVNSAIPFALYAFAAMHLAASMLAILNATAPMFGMVFGALFAGERVRATKLLGLVAGAAGVALVAQPAGQAYPDPLYGWAIAASLGACCGYGITGVLIKRYAGGAPPRGIAAGNQLGAALVLAPLLPFAAPAAAPTALVVASVLGLALLASALAFLLYFRLIADIGATRALTVTFLIPAFGALWGRLFLGESLPPGVLAGAVLIVAGTVFVTRS
jgi:drug/metabolite transporter (DMT)-like permease